jgi:hypothetical protein
MIKLGHKYRIVRPSEAEIANSNSRYGRWSSDHEQYIGREFVVQNNRAIYSCSSRNSSTERSFVKKFNMYFMENWLRDIGMGRCKVCGEALVEGAIKRADGGNGRPVLMCTHCFEQMYVACARCGNTHRRNDSNDPMLELEGALYCRNCAREMSKLSIDRLPPVNDDDIARTVALLDIKRLSFAPVQVKVAVNGIVEGEGAIVNGAVRDDRCVELAETVSEATVHLHIYGLAQGRPQHISVEGYSDREYETVKRILQDVMGSDIVITSERSSEYGHALGIRHDLRMNNFHDLQRALRAIAVVPQVQKKLITFENKVDKRFMAQFDKIMA